MADSKDQMLKKLTPINSSWMDEFRIAENGWQSWLSEAKEADDFFLGFQWSDEAKASRAARGKPTDTVNIIQPFVNIVVGSKRQTRLMPKAFPKRTDSLAMNTAQLITRLTRSIYSESQMREIDGQVFQDAVVAGRGGWKIKKGYNDDNKPQLYVKHQDQTRLYPDPNVPKDDLQMESARYIYEVSYHPKEFLMEKFPFIDWTGLADEVQKVDKQRNDVDYKGGLYRVIQKYELRREGYDYYFSQETGEIKFKVKSGTDQAEIRKKNPDTFVIENQTEKILYYSIVVPEYSNKTALWSGKHPLQMGRYPFVFAHAYVGSKGSYGVVANMRDTQRRMNTIRSLMVESLSKIPIQPWFIEDGSLVNGVKNFEKQITKTGGTILVAKGRKAPSQPQQPTIPPALKEFNVLLGQDAQATTGITPAAEGRSEGANEPAALYRQKLAQTNRTLSVIYDRFDDAQQYLWQSVIESIGDVYTEEDLITISIDDDTDPISQNDAASEGQSIQSIPINKKDVASDGSKAREIVLNKIGNTVNRYLVTMEMVQATANEAEEHLKLMTDFLQVFNDPTLNSIIAPALLKSSNLPKAHVIAKQYQEAKQAEAQAQAQQAQQENERENITAQTRAEKNRAEVQNLEVQNMKAVGEMQSMTANEEISENFINAGVA